MLKAIILDFNGVILNDEPVHYAAMREAVAGLGVDLKEEDYWDKYLPFDDIQCLEAICRDNSIPVARNTQQETLALKSQLYHKLLPDHFRLFPGVTEFIKAAALLYPLALASGARRAEIESALESTGLKRYFVLIAAAEDFVKGKPHPESFVYALQRLNDSLDSRAIQPGECLVIEDSVRGIQAAKAAGMVCLAVTNSYPRNMLEAADLVIDSLEEVRVDNLKELFGESA